jgi:hypothetical protein
VEDKLMRDYGRTATAAEGSTDELYQRRLEPQRGFARPGAMQMLWAGILLALESLGPIFAAAANPNHEWVMELTGIWAASLWLVTAIAVVLYCIGFVRYCMSKGYSGWIGFFLLIGNLPGFIVMLLLPDER